MGAVTTALLQVTSTALLALPRCEFCAVFARLRSVIPVAALDDFVVTLKEATW
jgi:hypothetical protein